MRIFTLLFLLTWSLQNYAEKDYGTIRLNKDLSIKQIAPTVFMHISNIYLKDGTAFPCNGIVYASKNEALIIDTPVNNKLTELLISWVQDTLKLKITAVVVTHFHEDCLGGLEAMHNHEIPSYAEFKTINRAIKHGATEPIHGFNVALTLAVGNKIVTNRFFGQGHTEDNIVCYLKKDRILFGGCLVRAVGAGKGNLEDANTAEWSETIERLMRSYLDIKMVVPGHGDEGGIELLNYTKALFVE